MWKTHHLHPCVKDFPKKFPMVFPHLCTSLPPAAGFRNYPYDMAHVSQGLALRPASSPCWRLHCCHCRRPSAAAERKPCFSAATLPLRKSSWPPWPCHEVRGKEYYNYEKKRNMILLTKNEKWINIPPWGLPDLHLQSNVYFALAGPCKTERDVWQEFEQILFSKCKNVGV